MLQYLFYQFGLLCLRLFPASVVYYIARLIMEGRYLFSLKDKRAVLNNLQNLVPDASNLDALARDMFCNFGRYLVEFFQLGPSLDSKNVHDHVTIENTHYLDQVQQEGHGGILLTAHLGNWELGASVTSLLGYPVAVVALEHKVEKVNSLFNRQREQKGIEVIPSKRAVKRGLETLRANKFLALVGDRSFSGYGNIVLFLGKKVRVPRGPAVLAQKAQAPIIPIFLIRKQGLQNQFILKICQPIYPTLTSHGSEKENMIRQLMKQYLKVIENMIYANPTQWLMFREYSI